MALNIPMPGSYGDAFTKGASTGSEIMQRMVMNPYDMRLKQAQAQNQDAEAQKSILLQRMLEQASNQANSGSGQQMDMNKALLLSGELKLPTQVVDGMLITSFGNYPVGETKQQERDSNLQKEKDIKTFDINSKKQADVMDSAYALKNSYGQLKRTKELFEKRPDLTGIIPGLLAKYHLSNDKDLAEGIAGFKKMQAALAKSATARPGIGSVNWAEKAKASEFDRTDFNLGKLKEMEDDMREEYNTYRKQYKESTGQEMPTFEKFMEEEEKAANANPGATQQPAQQPAQQPVAPGQQQPPQMPPQATPQGQLQKALASMPPQLRAMAEDAISKGANPQAVLQEAMKLLNPGAT